MAKNTNDQYRVSVWYRPFTELLINLWDKPCVAIPCLSATENGIPCIEFLVQDDSLREKAGELDLPKLEAREIALENL